MTDTLLPVSARAITDDLIERLRRHYLPPKPMPGGVFVTEVGQNGTWNGLGSSRCDAVYIGFTSTSGRILVGHEVKATRSDWLNELREISKADAWADQCHEWWLVTVPGVVLDGELPAGWGLMVPGTSRTRMRVVVPAKRHLDRQPSWDAVRSIIARLDTLHARARAEFEIALEPKVRARVEQQLTERFRQEREYERGRERKALALLERLNGLLGVEIDDYGAEGSVTPDEIRDLAELLRVHVTLREAQRALAPTWERGYVSRIARHASALDALLRQIDADEAEGEEGARSEWGEQQ